MCWASALSTPARAQPEMPRAQLVYEVGEHNDECPDEAALRAEIARRLDADPFTDAADIIVRVTIERTPSGYAASIRVTRGGETIGSRELETKRSCATLGRAVALAVTLVLLADDDEPAPAPAAREPPRASQRARPAPTPVAHLAADETPTRPTATTTEVGATMGAHVGLLPTPGDSVGVQARLRWSRWSFGAELAWSPPAETALAGGDLRASLLSGAFSPCWHRASWGLCGVGTVGVLRAEGTGYTTNSAATTPYVGAGARATWELSLTSRLAARVRIDMNATLVRARLSATGSPAGEWSAPPGSAAAGLSLVGRFQ